MKRPPESTAYHCRAHKNYGALVPAHASRSAGASFAQPQDELLRRAHFARTDLRRRTGADLARGRWVICPTLPELRQRKFHVLPFGMAVRLETRHVLAQRSSKAAQVPDRVRHVVVVGHQERLDSHRWNVLGE